MRLILKWLGIQEEVTRVVKEEKHRVIKSLEIDDLREAFMPDIRNMVKEAIREAFEPDWRQGVTKQFWDNEMRKQLCGEVERAVHVKLGDRAEHEVVKAIDGIINPEQFIDSVVERIKNKQI